MEEWKCFFFFYGSLLSFDLKNSEWKSLLKRKGPLQHVKTKTACHSLRTIVNYPSHVFPSHLAQAIFPMQTNI